VVSANSVVYALPLNYYQWGIYYKKSVFAKLSISPPANWQELLAVIATLKVHDIVPFSLNGGSKWSLAAWFDYLNLRLNGLGFHLALLSGKINFTDPRVVNIFTHWKQLIEVQAFDVRNLDFTWKQSLPLLYRNYTAMTLMGNFFVAHIPDSMKSEFNFIAFPNLISDMPRYEDVPFDLAVVAESTKEPAAALTFLKFLAEAETQAMFSNYVGKISPNLHAKVADQYFIIEGKHHIESAAGAAQYFDRDSPQGFSNAANDVFYDFVKSPKEINETVVKLEALRGQHFSSQNK
jgi:multiple sugar transport system substrate-binding protein